MDEQVKRFKKALSTIVDCDPKTLAHYVIYSELQSIISKAYEMNMWLTTTNCKPICPECGRKLVEEKCPAKCNNNPNN